MSNRNNFKKSLLYILFGLVFPWLIDYIWFAFVLAEIDPISWTSGERTGMIITNVILSIVIISISFSYIDDNKY